jgi:hypothetical protein
MTTINVIEPPGKLAKITGILYFLVILAGITCEIINQNLIYPGDINTTISNIISHGSLYRFSFVISLVRFIIFILLILSLHKIFRLVDRELSLAMVVIALGAIVIGIVILLFQYAAPLLISSSNYSTYFPADQLQAQIWFFLNLQKFGDKTCQIFSVWLLPLGYLIYKSGFTPKILGVLMVIAGSGYVSDFLIFILFPNSHLQIAGFAFLAELPFPVWLVIKGFKSRKWKSGGVNQPA